MIDPECEAMRDELRLYSWPVDRLTGQVIAGVNPIDANNHVIDCRQVRLEDLIIDAPLEEDDGGVLLLPMWRPDPVRPALAPPALSACRPVPKTPPQGAPKNLLKIRPVTLAFCCPKYSCFWCLYLAPPRAT